MAHAYDFVDAARKSATRTKPAPVEKYVHTLDAEPVRVRDFTTDVSSSSEPGSDRAIAGLFSEVRQTTSSNLWQDDECVRRVLANLIDELLVAAAQLPDNSVSEYAAKDNLFELRRLTGFTWDELAKFVGVDRRTLHNWAQGDAVRPQNRKQLADAVQFLRFVNRGSPEENRIVLGVKGTGGISVTQLVAERRFREARELVGPGLPATRRVINESYRLAPLGVGYFTSTESLEAGDVEEAAPVGKPSTPRRKPIRRR